MKERRFKIIDHPCFMHPYIGEEGLQSESIKDNIDKFEDINVVYFLDSVLWLANNYYSQIRNAILELDAGDEYKIINIEKSIDNLIIKGTINPRDHGLNKITNKDKVLAQELLTLNTFHLIENDKIVEQVAITVTLHMDSIYGKGDLTFYVNEYSYPSNELLTISYIKKMARK